jgi:IS5 family transposase
VVVTIADLAMLDDLWDELQRGKVYECSLRADRMILDGLQDGEYIYVDPRPAVLETLVHELLHRRKPRLSERTVGIRARNLVVKMDDTTKARWWRAYQRIKRKGPPVEVDA